MPTRLRIGLPASPHSSVGWCDNFCYPTIGATTSAETVLVRLLEPRDNHVFVLSHESTRRDLAKNACNADRANLAVRLLKSSTSRGEEDTLDEVGRFTSSQCGARLMQSRLTRVERYAMEEP